MLIKFPLINFMSQDVHFLLAISLLSHNKILLNLNHCSFPDCAKSANVITSVRKTVLRQDRGDREKEGEANP